MLQFCSLLSEYCEPLARLVLKEMDEKRNEGRKLWAQRHPDVAATRSMKRRMVSQDYQNAAIYMVTMCMEGRRACLGTLYGPDETHPQPWVAPTPLGERVKAEWLGIPRYYPQIRILAVALMPDHLHGIVHVQETLPVHLGQVISGFKAGCNRIARTVGQQCPLWEKGYNDKVLRGGGQLNRWFEYLRDNPRRLWIKRQHHSYFTMNRLTIAGNDIVTMGNLSLLERSSILQVRCSRRMTDDDIDHESNRLLDLAAKGAVLVSPSISHGEKTIMGKAIEAGYPVILIRDNGFDVMSKPEGRLFDACAEGKVLLISKNEHHNDYQPLTEDRCREMNVLARAIARQQ